MRLRKLLIHLSAALLIPGLLFTSTSCKESITRHKKAQQKRDIDKVSKSIEHFTSIPQNDEEQTPVVEQPHVVLDLLPQLKLDNPENQTALPAPQRCAMSSFPSDAAPKIIRVSIALRGVPKNLHDEVEHRVLNLLNAHAPQPWELRKVSSIDKHEQVWGRLDVEFKKQTLRLKRVSKTAQPRAEISFGFKTSFSGPSGLTSSWHDFNFGYRDEIAVSSENTANAQYWQKLEAMFPTLTVIDSDATAQWMRAQGLVPLILSDGLSAFRQTGHTYYPTGCLVSDSEQHSLQVRQLQQPYAPPKSIDVPNLLDLYCGSNHESFVVSAETPLRMALYYQPKSGGHAWKSQLTFEDSIHEGDLKLFVDDDLVCLYTGNNPQQNRGVEVQCLDRKTGYMRWRSKRLTGALRGFASDNKQLVFANDQALFSISRQGEIIAAQPLKTSSRMRNRLSCQLQNRLIFMMGTGHFISWNLDKNEFDWQAAVFDSDFIHCSQQNTLLFSEVGGYILAYDVEQNKPLWKYKTVSTPLDAFSYGNIIYLLLDRAIIALDRVTGQQKAQIPLPWAAVQFIHIGPKLFLDTKDAIYSWR